MSKQSKPRSSAELPSPLPEGTVRPKPRRRPAVQANLEDATDPKVASLLVWQHGENLRQPEYSVDGFCAAGKQAKLSTGRCPVPDLRLQRLNEEDRYATRIAYSVEQFSRQNPRLQEWLASLLATAGSIEAVVVTDMTGDRLPWEAFLLSGLAARDFLGGRLPVVRCIPQRGAGDGGIGWWRTKGSPKPGRGIAYVSGDLDSPRQPDQDIVAMEKTMARGFCGARCHDNTRDFLSTVNAAASDVALVYLACHATFDHNDYENISFGTRNQHDAVSLAELGTAALRAIRNSGSVVFINACNSGRLNTRDKYFPDEVARGLATCFIDSGGAQGVLATFGGVRAELAYEFANAVVTEFRKKSPPPIGEVLRSIRAHALEALPTDPQPEDWAHLLHTFLYVYYGSPFTNVQLLGP